MNALVFTAAQVAAMFPPELKVTEHWVNKTARRHGIGTLIRRKRVFTQAQVDRLIELQAVEASTPKPARKTAAPAARQTAQAKKPKQKRPDATVTPLQARPDRARSYGRSAS
ncbi:hypothetical protein ACQEUU_36910 [Nonomuraea sp. CA-218870]|uniref:hypothetical protein n=1 Tax=Nonomuraea sp. CA-218870 TaxID=3239998 RepID=UPI003D91FC12